MTAINFFVGFFVGLLVSSQLLVSTKCSSSIRSDITHHTTQSLNSTSTRLTTLTTNPVTEQKISLNHDNIAEFYEEYYKYYELNKIWSLRSFLGVQFLQNPNDAITVAEILYSQDVDLVIETGTYRGAAALFFASIMYQYRYDANKKFVRPFKIITMDINFEARQYIDRFPLLAPYILFIPESSTDSNTEARVNKTFFDMKPSNVFISLDGNHYAASVYSELVFYQQYVVNINNYILVQDTRLSKQWHPIFCLESKYDGPCNGPQEAVNWFLKNEGQGQFQIDPSREYLFSTHHKGWLKRISK